jgi:hypothetical protein
MRRAIWFLALGLMCMLAVSACNGGSRLVGVPGGAWVRYHNPEGWSLSYPRDLYIESLPPAGPCAGCPGGGEPVTTLTLANFPKGPTRAARVESQLGLSRSRHLPADGMVLQITGGPAGGLLPRPDARFPLSFKDFRPASWPNLAWRHSVGVPPPVNHTVDAGGQVYHVRVWLGPRTASEMRNVVARIISSIRFRALRPGTVNDGVAVFARPSHYPVRSLTLIHVGGSACAAGTTACRGAGEPVYLVHAPGRYRWRPDAAADTRCIPASSCVGYGSFYAIGWKSAGGYPSACNLRLDRRARRFYCTNMHARWDVLGRPIAVPPHQDPTDLSFENVKIAWDGHLLVGFGGPPDISVRNGLWPAGQR